MLLSTDGPCNRQQHARRPLVANKYLATHSVITLERPLYSLHLAPPDLLVLPSQIGALMTVFQVYRGRYAQGSNAIEKFQRINSSKDSYCCINVDKALLLKRTVFV